MYALRAALLDIALGGCGLAGAPPSTGSCASRLVLLSAAYGTTSTFASGAFSERAADMVVDVRGQGTRTTGVGVAHYMVTRCTDRHQTLLNCCE